MCTYPLYKFIPVELNSSPRFMSSAWLPKHQKDALWLEAFELQWWIWGSGAPQEPVMNMFESNPQPARVLTCNISIFNSSEIHHVYPCRLWFPLHDIPIYPRYCSFALVVEFAESHIGIHRFLYGLVYHTDFDLQFRNDNHLHHWLNLSLTCWPVTTCSHP